MRKYRVKSIPHTVVKLAVMYCLGLYRRLFATKRDFPLFVDEYVPNELCSIESCLQNAYDNASLKKSNPQS